MKRYVLYSEIAKGFLASTKRDKNDNIIREQVEVTESIDEALKYDTIGEGMKTSSDIYASTLINSERVFGQDGISSKYFQLKYDVK